MKYVLIGIVLFTFVSCTSGYTKEEDKWVWISHDTGVGKRTSQIDEHDFKSFTPLDNNYAKDKFNVFYRRTKIAQADPNTFETIKKGYSKDKYHVYLNAHMVVLANPQSFEILEFPYSKDDNYVFNGTLPLNLDGEKIQEFEILKEKDILTSGQSTTTLSHFIERNPKYKWLDTLGINGIIIGPRSIALVNNKKFIGIEETNK